MSLSKDAPAVLQDDGDSPRLFFPGAGSRRSSASAAALRRSRCARHRARRLEHAVAVGGLVGDGLDHVPMLDDLAVLELEDVDDGRSRRVGLAPGMDVQDDVIAIGADLPNLAMRGGIFVAPEGGELLEALRPVPRGRVV